MLPAAELLTAAHVSPFGSRPVTLRRSQRGTYTNAASKRQRLSCAGAIVFGALTTMRAQRRSFGVRVSPSPVLRNLLQHYPSGGQFISEALQNAEDTDRATKFCAVLDLQHHPTDQIRQDHRTWRERFQGPAILFYDNGGFRDRDWESLQQIYNSEKRHSPSEVGKYGMGSRSFFHIGDNIQIVSGTKYAVLDPDEKVSDNGEFGAILDMVTDDFEGKPFHQAYPDECAPFRDFFGCTMEGSFPGTIIRATWPDFEVHHFSHMHQVHCNKTLHDLLPAKVPLRLKPWASESSFMPEEFDSERAKKIFQD